MSGKVPDRQAGPFDSLSCPRCGAGVDTSCTNTDGTIRKIAHLSRGLEWVRQADEALATGRTHDAHDNGPGTNASQ